MKRVRPNESWPAVWKAVYGYDRAEIYGEPDVLGYAYAYDARRAHTLRLIDSVLQPGARILDVAAAQGNFTLALAEKGYRVTWNDLRAELADYVREKFEFGDVTYAPGNAFELEQSDPFDAVLITEIIEHVAHPDEFLRRVARLVRPGGYIVMTTPNGAYFQNRLPKFSDFPDPSVFESTQFQPNADGHIFLLHRDEIERLARDAGLEVLELSLFTNPLTAGYMKMEALLRVFPRGVVRAVERVSTKLPLPLREKLLIHTAALLRVPTS
ncbi:MAG TPA: methyltransferase domain-containing protein [Chthoniobacterales bacterium]